MNSLGLLATIGLLIASNTTWAAPIPVAVFDIQVLDVPGFETKKMDKFHRLLDQAVSTSGFGTVPRSQLEKAQVDKLKAESYKSCYDESCQIEIGKELAAQKSLSSTWTKLGSTCTLIVKLLDLRTQVSEFSTKSEASCDESGLAKSIERVTYALEHHRSGVRAAIPQKDRDLTKKVEKWRPKTRRKSVVIEFSSTPPGAMVRVDGELVCQDSAEGCSKAIELGVHEISMEKQHYILRTEKLTITEAKPVHWTLEANFGRLFVTSTPSGEPVSLNGARLANTPIRGHELAPGTYQVKIDSRCFYPAGKEISIVRNEDKTVALDLSPRIGAVDVSAKDDKGHDKTAQVSIDGKVRGQTPDIFEASVCAQGIEVSAEGYETWSSGLSVEERKEQAITATLSLEPAREIPEHAVVSDSDQTSWTPLLVSGLGVAAVVAGVVIGENAVSDYKDGGSTYATYPMAQTADALVWTGGVTALGGLVWGLVQ